MARETGGQMRIAGGQMRIAGLLVFSMFGAAALAGCGEAEEGPPEVSADEGAKVAEIGEAAAGELMRTLVGRLTAAMEEGGAAHAVEFCSQEAMPLTRMVESEMVGDVELKRTSFRYRNPENAPDEAETQALRYFEDAMEAGGGVPSRYVQQVSAREYRYYQPLFVGEVCLQCHGDPENISPAVLEKLEANYPADLATGYEAGDFRGLVRVTVPAEMVEEG